MRTAVRLYYLRVEQDPDARTRIAGSGAGQLSIRKNCRRMRRGDNDPINSRRNVRHRIHSIRRAEQRRRGMLHARHAQRTSKAPLRGRPNVFVADSDFVSPKSKQFRRILCDAWREWQ
jgi:hypothetical protein